MVLKIPVVPIERRLINELLQLKRGCPLPVSPARYKRRDRQFVLVSNKSSRRITLLVVKWLNPHRSHPLVRFLA